MKYRTVKRTAAFLLACLMWGTLFISAASADTEMRRTVIGADLTEEQIAATYSEFGFARGTVPELRLTNAEERTLLEGHLDSALIGTKAMSCVYLELLPKQSGMTVSVKNISWCTPEMYIGALTTAGITDAKVLVAAPFSVSGTAALAGIYKAYEDMTGQSLDDAAKSVSTQELTVTGELANEIGSEDSTSIVNDLKLILDQTANMTDEQLRETIQKIAEKYHVTLTETQIRQLMELCRSMERLNPGELAQRVEDVESTLEKVAEAKDQVVGFFQAVRDFFASIRDFFERVNNFFHGR